MRTLDKFEEVTTNAKFATTILGNLSTGEFELVDLDAPDATQKAQALADRGLVFLGAMGLVEGVPRVALSEPLEPSTCSALSQAFLQLVENKLNASLFANAEDVAWLERVYSLPDPRTVN